MKLINLLEILNMTYVNLMIIPCILFFTVGAQALECEVDYIAKKAKEDRRWFGTVKETKVKSGMEEGKGETKSECRDNALLKLTSDGWLITSEKVWVR